MQTQAQRSRTGAVSIGLSKAARSHIGPTATSIRGVPSSVPVTAENNIGPSEAAATARREAAVETKKEVTINRRKAAATAIRAAINRLSTAKARRETVATAMKKTAVLTKKRASSAPIRRASSAPLIRRASAVPIRRASSAPVNNKLPDDDLVKAMLCKFLEFNKLTAYGTPYQADEIYNKIIAQLKEPGSIIGNIKKLTI